MNIFVLDRDPIKSAKMLCDVHVNKMPKEAYEMLILTYEEQGVDKGPLHNISKRHYNHTCTRWVRRSKENFEWLLAHAEALYNESVRRGYNLIKTRTYLNYIQESKHLLTKFNSVTQTPFVLAMGFDQGQNLDLLEDARLGIQLLKSPQGYNTYIVLYPHQAELAYQEYYRRKQFKNGKFPEWKRPESVCPSWYYSSSAKTQNDSGT